MNDPPAIEPDTALHLAQTLFAFRGRLGRVAFASGTVATGIAALALVYVSVMLAGNDQTTVGGAISVAAAIAALFALWPLTALLAKRLHDLNCSAWHSVWLVALWLVPNFLPDALSSFVTIAAVVTLLWLIAMPGSTSPNRYDAT